jgi:hypothetical protein
MPRFPKDLQGIFRSAVSNANQVAVFNGKKHERFLVTNCVPRYAPAPNLLAVEALS